MPIAGDRPLRILHAPRNIAGQAGDVVAALQRLGHDAELWQDGPDSFGRSADRVFDGSGDAKDLLELVLDAAARFDVLHFHYAETLIPRRRHDLPPYWDLPVYRALGLRVHFTFHGSDIRLGRVHREANPWSAGFSGTSEPDDDRVEKALQVIRTYADEMFVVSVNYLAYAPDATYLPRAIDLARWPEAPVAQRARPVVVHAPTRRGTKGTDRILADLDRLREEGVDFELRLLEGVSHATVRAELAGADVLVDNILAGAYGVVSLEAMASGKVAVANLSEAVRRQHPDTPVVHVDPDTFLPEMRRLLTSPAARTELALRGRPFVAAVHDAAVIARRLETAYRAPRQEVGRRSMPDWTSMARVRRIETLESQLDRLGAELRRSQRREADLRSQLGLGDGTPSGLRRPARRALPRDLRARIMRATGHR
ncbi:MAG: glycosyltransferase family protein [Candidatus Limnocylindrales bacterium]